MRIALGLTQATEAEFVAVVEIISAVAGAEAHDLVVPALDVPEARARVDELLPGGAGRVRVESANTYLTLGHDIAALISDDAAIRGRQAAAAAAGRDLAGLEPGEVVVWLAHNTSLHVPDQLASPPGRGDLRAAASNDRVVVRTRAGGNLVCPRASPSVEGVDLFDVYDPREVLGLERLLRAGDSVIDASAGVGAIAVRMAQLVGPRGHVTGISRDPAARALLEENLVLNGVDRWADAADDASRLDEATVDVPIALIRATSKDVIDALHRAMPAIESGRVERLLLRLDPASLRTGDDPVRACLERCHQDFGATFSVVTTGGATLPTTIERALASDDSDVLLVDLDSFV